MMMEMIMIDDNVSGDGIVGSNEDDADDGDNDIAMMKERLCSCLWYNLFHEGDESKDTIKVY